MSDLVNGDAPVKLLAACTASVQNDYDSGTAFFVAPGLMLTCAHVVMRALSKGKRIEVDWRRSLYEVTACRLFPECESVSDPYPYPDLALLAIAVGEHPWVGIEPSEPRLFPEPDQLFSYGWTKVFNKKTPRGTPVLFNYESGFADASDTDEETWRFQLKDGQVLPGMSGAPVLNVRTGRVCAMLTRTRESRVNLGGWGVPIARHIKVFSELDSLPSAYRRSGSGEWQTVRKADIAVRVHGTLHPAYRSLPPLGDRTPSILLRSEFGVVPFRWRNEELADLIRWCENPAAGAVRLISGQGGAGKTRLAAQLCEEMSGKEWITGFLKPYADGEALKRLRDIGDPVLVVVDYAETFSSLQRVIEWVEELAVTQPRIRLLLLARRRDGWWQRLCQRLPQIPMSDQILKQAVMTPGERVEAYRDALSAFGAHIRGYAPGHDDLTLLSQLGKSPILILHMAALLQADVAKPTPLRLGENKKRHLIASAPRPAVARVVTRDILTREIDYWLRSVRQEGLDCDETLLRRCVAMATLIGAASEGEAAEVLARVQDLADAPAERRHRIARWIQKFYPPTEETEWLGFLQPDLLAEELVSDVFGSYPELVTAALERLDKKRAHRAIVILERACRSSRQFAEAIESALAGDPETLGPIMLQLAEGSEVLRKMLRSVVNSLNVGLPQLNLFWGAIPNNGVLLDSIAIDIGRRMVELARSEGDALLLAAKLDRLAIAFDRARRHREAIAAAAEAAHLLGEIEDDDPVKSGILLLRELRMLSMFQWHGGLKAEALSSLERAKLIAAKFVDADFSEFRIELEKIYRDTADHLSQLGRVEDTIVARQENIRMLERAASDGSPEVLMRLAAAQDELATVLDRQGSNEDAYQIFLNAYQHRVHLASHGEGEEAQIALVKARKTFAQKMYQIRRYKDSLEATSEVVRQFRELADRDQLKYGPELAASLHFESQLALTMGASEQAKKSISESVGIFRDIVSLGRTPEALKRLSSALHALCDFYSTVKARPEAVKVAEEAVLIRRMLAEQHHGSYWEGLASSQMVWAEHLRKADMPARASLVVRRAVDIRRDLATVSPQKYGPRFIGTLIESAKSHAGLGVRAEVKKSAKEAIKFARYLTGEQSGEFEPLLAKTLIGAGQAFRIVQDLQGLSIPLFDEAIDIRRELACRDFETYGLPLVRSLRYMVKSLVILGKPSEALPFADEAVATCAKLLASNPYRQVGRGSRSSHFGSPKRRPSVAMELHYTTLKLKQILGLLGESADANRIHRETEQILYILAGQKNSSAAEALAKVQRSWRSANPDDEYLDEDM